MHRLRQGARPSGARRQNRLGGLRGGAPPLIPYRGHFDGFHALPASVSKTCVVRFDNNKYSVNAGAVGRPVEIHAYADRIVIRQDRRVVAEHSRCFRRGETIYDPPGITCPFWRASPARSGTERRSRTGCCPGALDRARRKLAGSDNGDRQMRAILAAVLTDGLPALDTACAEALENGVHSSGRLLGGQFGSRCRASDMGDDPDDDIADAGLLVGAFCTVFGRIGALRLRRSNA